MRKKFTLVFGVLAFLMFGATIGSAAPGDLDLTFGNGGRIIYPTSGSPVPYWGGDDIVVQPDQKILVSAGHFNYSTQDYGLLLSRYLPSGSLDPTFGTNGRVTTVFPNLPQGCCYINGRVWGMAIQRDGKIATAGYRSGTDGDGNWNWSYTAIARYLGDLVGTRRARVDFDGDGRADVSVFRPTGRIWYLNQSQAGFSATQFGLSSDKITPADYDGDGKTDIAVYRDGVWYWLNSSNQSVGIVQFGLPDDVPVPADYTGDGRAEIAVYRNGTWWIQNLTDNQTQVINFGLSTDKPVVADYDGDGRADQAVYRNGEWHLNRSSQGYVVVNFGLATDKPVVSDYDGDGKADATVFLNGVWYLLQSANGISIQQFGLANDKPVPAAFLL